MRKRSPPRLAHRLDDRHGRRPPPPRTEAHAAPGEADSSAPALAIIVCSRSHVLRTDRLETSARAGSMPPYLDDDSTSASANDLAGVAVTSGTRVALPAQVAHATGPISSLAPAFRRSTPLARQRRRTAAAVPQPSRPRAASPSRAYFSSGRSRLSSRRPSRGLPEQVRPPSATSTMYWRGMRCSCGHAEVVGPLAASATRSPSPGRPELTSGPGRPRPRVLRDRESAVPCVAARTGRREAVTRAVRLGRGCRHWRLRRWRSADPGRP